MRTWGVYLIPRDKAPDEGFIIIRNTKAWRLGWQAYRTTDCIDGVPPKNKVYTAATTMEELVDQVGEKMTAADYDGEETP